MDRNTVVWWIFDPPSDVEQKSLDAMRLNKVVWLDENLGYKLLDKPPANKDEATKIVDEIREFAIHNNACTIIGQWYNEVYDIVKSSRKSNGIKCYSSRSVLNSRNKKYYHKFTLIGEI